MNGTDLLGAYRDAGSELAFGELVRRFTNLVYSAAKRRLSNSALAEDVTQIVFTRFANRAPKFQDDAELVAWLHRTTVHVAVDVWRSETRRRSREEKAAAMETTTSATEDDRIWDKLAPALDEELNRLAEEDRRALLLRFFDRRPMRDVGQSLGVSEDAAKMRVSRAVERLRTRLVRRGIVCSAALLGTLLWERTLEAAPGQLIAALRTLRRQSAGGIGQLAGPVFRSVGSSRFLVPLAVFVTMTVVFVLWFRPLSIPRGNDELNNRSKPRPVKSVAVGPTIRVLSMQPAQVNRPEPEPRVVMHVIDAETGAGLAGAKVHAAYFYTGGRGEPHDLVTDQSGNAAIPEALESGDHGMNVFVSAEGHVPKVINFRGKDGRSEYTMKLDRGCSAGGTIVDDQGQPVAGVTIRVQNGDPYRQGAENIDFQTCPVTSDANGQWLCTYIPKHYQEVRLILTRDDYAVTLSVVPLSELDPLKLVLVLERGFSVVGRVTDTEGNPIFQAEVRELHNYGYRRQSTQTGEAGQFVLHGLADFPSRMSRVPERMADGWTKIRGLSGSGVPSVNLVVQAEGFAPQVRMIRLLQPTNTADFTLSVGTVFRGRVLDEAGQPIAGAVAQTAADNQGLRKYEWSTRTDADGRFEWDSAPADPTLFWFEADGCEWSRGLLLTPDGSDHEIRLRRAGTK